MFEKKVGGASEKQELAGMVRSFSRADVEGFSVPELERNIVLPAGFYQATAQIARAERESRGVMLASVVRSEGKDFYVVEYMQTLGYGDKVSVFPSEEKRQAFIKMMQERGMGMKLVEYHSHTVGTGSIWRNRFSDGDFYTIEKMLAKNPDYMHVLFTPTNILTLSQKAAAFKLARGNQDALAAAMEKFEFWQEMFSTYSSKL